MRIPWLEEAGEVLDVIVGAALVARCAVIGHRWRRIPEYLGAPPDTWWCTRCGSRRQGAP
jgi:hypothetical protein